MDVSQIRFSSTEDSAFVRSDLKTCGLGLPHRFNLLFLLAFLATLVSPASADVAVDRGIYASEYEAATSGRILARAAAGDRLAQHQLASRFATGRQGTPRNNSEALRWYSSAAKQGSPRDSASAGGQLSASIDTLPALPIRASRGSVPGVAAAPVAVIASNVVEGFAPLDISLDASSSSAAQSVAVYSWRVTDAIYEGISQTLTFDVPGEYQVQLTVMDSAGRTDTAYQTITVNQVPDPEPIAVISTNLVTGAAPLQVDFNADESTDNGLLTYLWDFANGSSSELSSGSVTFAEPGEYSVLLTVTDTAEQSAEATVFITVTEPVVRPEVPVNISPIAKTNIVINSTASFSWVYDPSATTYDFHFFDKTDGNLTYVYDLDPALGCAEGVCTLPIQVTLPVLDNHAWRVRAVNSAGRSGWSRTIFNVIEPVLEVPGTTILVAPAAGDEVEAGVVARFQWQPLDNVDSYDFAFIDALDESVTTIPQLNAATYCSTGTCQLDYQVDLPVALGHQWRVRGKNLAGDGEWTTRSVQVIPLPTAIPDVPVPAAPIVQGGEDSVVISQGTEVQFVWNAANGAANYDLLLFDAVNGEETLIYDLDPDDICVADLCSHTTTLLLSVGIRHAWRVRASNSIGSTSFTRVRIDVTEPDSGLPLIPVLINPIAGAEVLINTTSNFTWNAVDTAESYDFELITPADTYPMETGLLPEDICDADGCEFSVVISDIEVFDASWRVRARNDIGLSAWASRGVNIVEEEGDTDLAPEANIVASALSGDAPLEVTFDGTASSDDIGLTNYRWFIASEEVASGEALDSFEYTFTGPGVYTVSLLVTDSNEQTDSTDITITAIGNQAPVASFQITGFAENASVLAPASIVVDPSSSSDDVEITNYLWDFGDGEAAQSNTLPDSLTHTYESPGTYVISLTVTDEAGLESTSELSVEALGFANSVSAIDAARLLTQATFGPTAADIAYVQSIGIEAWIDQQLLLQGPAHLDYVGEHSNGSHRGPRHEKWWMDAVEGNDQLRQRVAFALSEIFVIADTGRTLSNAQYGVTRYYDQLREMSFGNYRELLETVTLSPIMGVYLSMLQNARADDATNTRADENYAREVMQLFSIGLYELNPDGSSTGNNTYTQQQIEDFARVFTGWNFNDAGIWDRRLFTGQDMINPMQPWEDYHDTGVKTLLNGATTQAGWTARQDLEFALDNIFNHSTVGPFIGHQLIQKLVTSNPSAAYISRVSAVFDDNGNGERGDLAAVVKAVLMDSEARNAAPANNFGKVREPVLRLSHLWRAFNIQRGSESTVRGEFNTNSPQLDRLETVAGQAVLRSPSVFNFFHPDFAPSGVVREAGLVAPVFEILTENTQLALSNRINQQIHRFFVVDDDSTQPQSYLDFSIELALAADADSNVLLNHLDLLLLNGSMSTGLREILIGHRAILAANDEPLSQHVIDVVSLIMASPEYQVQR